MRHCFADKRMRAKAFRKFTERCAPRESDKLTNAEKKRLRSYAYIAFTTAFFAGMNYYRKNYTKAEGVE